MANTNNVQSEKLSTKQRKNFKYIIRYTVRVCVFILIVVFFVIWYLRSDSYFIGQLKTKANSQQNLQLHYMQLYSQANSIQQHLMLLKRLDIYHMKTAFRNILEKALDRYKALELQALAIEYQLAMNNFTFFSTVPFDIVTLYTHYPALIRYYLYVLSTSSKTMPQTAKRPLDTSIVNDIMSHDEILHFLLLQQNNALDIYDYTALYNITGKELFRFVMYLYHTIQSNEQYATALFSSIDERWKQTNVSLIEKTYALLSTVGINEQAFLLQNSKTPQNSIENTYRIALSIYSRGDVDSTLLYYYNIIEKYGIRKLDNASLEFYFWLRRNYSQDYDSNVLNEHFLHIKDILYDSVALTLQYLLYLYVENDKESIYILEMFPFSTKVLNSPLVQYMQFLLEGHDIHHQNMFLQKKLEEYRSNKDTSLFRTLLELKAVKTVKYYNDTVISAFFSHYDVLKDILFPYRMYYLLRNNMLTHFSQDIQDSLIMTLHAHDGPWWHKLNTSVWNIENKHFNTALQYLHLSQNNIPQLFFSLQSLHYVQYIRIAILQQDYTLAHLYLSLLEILEPTNPYIASLQNMLP